MIRRAAGAAAGLLACLGACGREPAEAPLDPRVAHLTRWTAYHRPADGGLYFLDRFELRVEELGRALRRQGPPPEPDLPAVRLDLYDAAEAAAVFWGRLPRFDEWRHAVEGRAGFRFPWGDRFESLPAMRANTLELGLVRRTRVGTFESGRDPSRPDACYDLFGNVEEWLVDPPPGGGSGLEGIDCARFVLEDGLPAGLRVLLCLLEPWGGVRPFAAEFLAFPPAGERVAVGTAGFGYLDWIMPHAPTERRRAPVERLGLVPRDPRERAGDLGVRLATDPWCLLAGLARSGGRPSAADRRALARFLGRYASAFRAAGRRFLRVNSRTVRGDWFRAALDVLGIQP